MAPRLLVRHNARGLNVYAKVFSAFLLVVDVK